MSDPDLKFDGTRVVSDTHPDIERKMIELIRTLTPAQKLAKISEMGRFMKQAAFAETRRRYPNDSDHDVMLRVVFALNRAGTHVESLRLGCQGEGLLVLTEAEQVIEIVTSIFDRLDISYLVGGSVASGIHGVYRYTNDVDVVADISADKVEALAAAFAGFYADEEMIRDGVKTATSFSVIHLGFMIKVDVFLKVDDEWTNEVWQRRQFVPISSDGSLKVYLPSAEDAILQKLRWFQMGGGVSDRQWGDVLGMLKTGAGNLDYAYMREWAPPLGLVPLLEKAVGMASIG